MPVKALPPVAPGVNWTGFYVGGHVGYGWGTKDFSLPDIAGEKFGDCSGKQQECFDFSKLGSPALSHKLAGLLGGVQAGFNLQSGAFVYGVEGDLSWTNMKEDSLSKLGEFRFVNCWYDVNKEIDLKAHTEVNWVASIAGRIGYAVDRVLIYAKGGVAFADQDYNWVVTKGSHEIATAKFSDTRTGWMVGGGAEWALWRNWSANAAKRMCGSTSTSTCTSSSSASTIASACRAGEGKLLIAEVAKRSEPRGRRGALSRAAWLAGIKQHIRAGERSCRRNDRVEEERAGAAQRSDASTI
jgi:outer membrane immunogenic protein